MTDADLPTAIITGAGGGIGRAIARRIAAAGYRVIAVDRAQRAVDETVAVIRQNGDAAVASVLDITDAEASGKMIGEAGDLRLLVNNAGIFDVIAFDSLTADDFRRMYEVNVIAMATLCQQAARRMRPQSRIVNLASRAAFGARDYAHYVASKAAVAGLTKALALELAAKHITVNAIAPGVIETDMLKARPDALDDLRAQQPTGRLGSPEDIAHAVAFFAHPQAGFVTGQVLIVDGGRSVGGTAAF
ncbi:MAG: SDR family NAD(P)-dependent oxidoreductase [Paracoccus sp. (in: a-proteobacteria)]|nr:SDR family NAD(P)-dependent oxidoreductase [Paracoccus sp. (in: a-proteobacteria)]